MPLLSVIIPIYNVEKYLHQCVDSVLCQHFDNMEIILVNDGSPDNCPQICNEYEKKYPFIKALHKERSDDRTSIPSSLKTTAEKPASSSIRGAS